MMIYEKMDTIAILKATGYAGSDVKKIFILIALSIGLMGAIVGALLGFLLCKIIDGQNIFEHECNDYMIKLFREKSKFQSDIIMQCIIAARNGDSRDILTKESIGFYKLVNVKAKECSYGE